MGEDRSGAIKSAYLRYLHHLQARLPRQDAVQKESDHQPAFPESDYGRCLCHLQGAFQGQEAARNERAAEAPSSEHRATIEVYFNALQREGAKKPRTE